jgi:hypothetical protein
MAHLRPTRGRRQRETATGPVSARPASPGDADALERLAQLESVHLRPGPMLLAEVDSELRAALSLSDGRVLADPFHPTERLVELLKERATELSG